MDSSELSKDDLEDKLETHLKGCADEIRNAVDKTDYKDVILPVVFYKAVSDTYKDEKQEVKEEYDDEDVDPTDDYFHKFQIPEEYLFDKALNKDKKVGEFLNEVFNELERSNPEKLEGAFNVDYAGEQGLDDGRLKRLLQHLGKNNLSVERLPPDVLGKAYMDLVRHFAEEEGRDGGEFFTPPNIVELMVKILAPFEKGDSFHDPTAGSGGMLIEAARHFKEEQEGDPAKLTLTGQEVNPDVTAIGKINIYLHDYNGDIRRGDSLSNPKFLESDGTLEKFDYVLANFPFSASWDKEGLQDDPYNRFGLADKLPRADRGDYAFIQHMTKQLNDEGECAVVIPHGVLFRKHESRYREPMIEQDMIEAVIGLPENLFQNNSIPSAIMLINKDKPEERKNQIQFIHAADNNNGHNFYEELSNQNKLTQNGIQHIVDNFNQWKTEERVSRVVDLEEIRENDYNLNIALYVDTTEPEENIEVSKELEKLHQLQSEREEIENQMTEHMEALNYE
ncbi:N-6 DNA methylase [Nanohaloarchaea archaeon]|nr:N-6 DNA methylase [Candidatus Nanohaloarchaea archaeon]